MRSKQRKLAAYEAMVICMRFFPWRVLALVALMSVMSFAQEVVTTPLTFKGWQLAPNHIKVQAPTAHSVLLAWTASTTPGVTYNVFRSGTTGACGSVKIAVGITGLNFTDSNVTSGATYFYNVDAQNSVGDESACAVEAQVQIPVPPAPPTGFGAKVQ